MRWAQFQDHLVLLAEVNRLSMLSPAEIPNVHLVAVAAREQGFGIEPVLNFVWSSPFAGDQRVMSEMPPEIVSQFLGSAIEFPSAQNVEVEVIENENSAWTAAVWRAKGADVNALRTTMNRVGT